MHVRGAHAVQLIFGPLLGLGKLGRAGQPRANVIKQAARIFHDVRVVQAFIANPRNGIQIELFGRNLLGGLGGWLSFGFIVVLPSGKGANGYKQDGSGYFHSEE